MWPNDWPHVFLPTNSHSLSRDPARAVVDERVHQRVDQLVVVEALGRPHLQREAHQARVEEDPRGVERAGDARAVEGAVLAHARRQRPQNDLEPAGREVSEAGRQRRPDRHQRAQPRRRLGRQPHADEPAHRVAEPRGARVPLEHEARGHVGLRLRVARQIMHVPLLLAQLERVHVKAGVAQVLEERAMRQLEGGAVLDEARADDERRRVVVVAARAPVEQARRGVPRPGRHQDALFEARHVRRGSPAGPRRPRPTALR
jgi:hypothetical protein